MFNLTSMVFNFNYTAAILTSQWLQQVKVIVTSTRT